MVEILAFSYSYDFWVLFHFRYAHASDQVDDIVGTDATWNHSTVRDAFRSASCHMVNEFFFVTFCFCWGLI